jgi:hypothetical protein
MAAMRETIRLIARGVFADLNHRPRDFRLSEYDRRLPALLRTRTSAACNMNALSQAQVFTRGQYPALGRHGRCGVTGLRRQFTEPLFSEGVEWRCPRPTGLPKVSDKVLSKPSP